MCSARTATSILAAIITLCVFHSANAFSNHILPASNIGTRHGSCRVPKFAAFSRALRPTTTLPSLRMGDSAGGGLSDDDISGLLSRVAQAKKRVEELPLLVFDAMLPKQRLGIQTANPVFRCGDLSQCCFFFSSLSVSPCEFITHDPWLLIRKGVIIFCWKCSDIVFFLEFRSLTEACDRGMCGMLGIDPYKKEMMRYGTEVSHLPRSVLVSIWHI
jgi:hypothetical protein